MRRTCLALSPKLKVNKHPKNAVAFLPGTAGFWKPKYGASKMKWNFNVPYVREIDSLHHFPEVSAVTGKPVNWYHDEPKDGYDGHRDFGEHTLQLEGMPLGRTPEYMQERLRRFFSKFGPVVQCRADPHEYDPYQCGGRAWVTFRDHGTALRALRAPLKYPASLHDKVVSMEHLHSGKRNDPDYYEKSKLWNRELVKVARDLHVQLCRGDARGKPLARAGEGLLERELLQLPKATAVRGRGGIAPSKGLAGAPTRLVPAGPAVRRRFGSWEAFLAEAPFDELFKMEESTAGGGDAIGEDSPGLLVVRPRLVSTVQRARILARARMMLGRRLHEEFSQWWREGKISLPEYTQRRVTWWDHKPPLPFEVQIQSRSKEKVKIYDERFLYRRQLIKNRNEQRNERRAEWATERRSKRDAQEKRKQDRYDQAMSAIDQAKCGTHVKLVGRSLGMVPRLGQSPRVTVNPARPQTAM